mgnify:CR=1 FL=1
MHLKQRCRCWCIARVVSDIGLPLIKKNNLKAFIICIILLSAEICSYGQTESNDANRLNNRNQPLVIVKGLQTDLQHLFIDPSNIDSVSIIKATIAISQFGEAGANGVLIVHPKNLASLLQLKAIYDKFQIGADAGELSMC